MPSKIHESMQLEQKLPHCRKWPTARQQLSAVWQQQ